MQDDKLDDDEQAILGAFDADEFESNLTPERRKFLAMVAEEALKKDKSVVATPL